MVKKKKKQRVPTSGHLLFPVIEKTSFVVLKEDVMIPRNATVIYKIETKASGKKELIVSNRASGSYQPMDGTKFGPYKPFQQ